MKVLFAILATIFTASFANASLCALDADLSGRSFHILVGGINLTGTGTIKCLDNKTGRFEDVQDVYVTMEGAGFGLGATKITNANLYSTGLGIVQSSEALTGKFVFVKTGFQLGPVGADAGASLYFSGKKGKKGVAIPFGMNFKKGEGLELNLLDFVKVNVIPMDL